MFGPHVESFTSSVKYHSERHIIKYSVTKQSKGSNGDPKPGPEVIKLFSCLTQLSLKFPLLINMKMPTIVGIFIFISRKKSWSAMFSKNEFVIVSKLKFISMKNFTLS